MILPTLSRNHVSNNPKAFAANIDWAFRMVCLLGIPAAVGLGVMARPILTVIFQRGAFTADTAIMASYSLTAYSFGLLSFMLVKVLAPGFYSRQDTKTPVKFGIWCMVANMVFNIVLAVPFGYIGLAVATSMSATLNAALLYFTLHQQGVFALSRTSILFIVRVLLSSAAMGGLIYYRDTGLAFFDLSLSAQVTEVAITIVMSVVLFLASMVVLGMRPRHFRSGGG